MQVLLPFMLVGAAAVVGLLAGRRRQWPLHTFSAAARLTFGAGASALLFAGSGIAGYRLSRYEQFVFGTAWVGGTIWWQVAVGGAFAAVAVYSWRQALRLAGESHGQS